MSTYGPGDGTLFGGSALDAEGQGTDARTLARRDDPDTSKEAAHAIAAKLTTEREYALACVTGNPGWTSAELEAHYKPHPEGRIRKRLAELERAGLVWRGVKRKCRINGTNAAVWWPTEGGST